MRFWRKKPDQAADSQPAAAPEAAAEEHAAVAGAPVAVAVHPQHEAAVEYSAEDIDEIRQQTERAVERSRRGLFGRIGGMFTRADFDDDLWEELEELLIASDTGLPTTERILADVRKLVKDQGIKKSAEVREVLRNELIDILQAPDEDDPMWMWGDERPERLVILVVGVNGAGKTTSIAKMAHAFKQDGASVILGAADTFRAAASDQLKVWGERVGVRVVAHQPNADPGAVVFDTMTAAEATKADIVIIDTAGRLHTKSNLMAELTKINRVVQRVDSEAPHETLLVLDATTGQNGLAQAKNFTDAVGITGIVLAKLDGTAKGGIAFAIANETGIPVRFIGTGEKVTDLTPFDAEQFVDALLA